LTLQDRLADVRGLDVALALRNIGGQARALEWMMRRFVSNYSEGVPEFPKPMEADTPSAWLAASHSLLGECSALGAVHLDRGLLTFERALGLAPRDQEAAHRARELQNELLQFVAQIRHGLDREIL